MNGIAKCFQVDLHAISKAIYHPMGVLPQPSKWIPSPSPASQPTSPAQPWPAQPSQPASPGQPTSQLSNQPTNQTVTSNQQQATTEPANNLQATNQEPTSQQESNQPSATSNQQPEGPAAGAKPSDIRRPPAGGAGRVQTTTQILQILKLQGPRPCRRPLPKVTQNQT